MNDLNRYPIYGPTSGTSPAKREEKKPRRRKPKKKPKKSKKPPRQPVVSAVLADGSIVETVHERELGRTRFAVWKDGELSRVRSVRDGKSRLVPYRATNTLLRNGVVLLSSEPVDFGDVGDLVGAVQAYIHRYVDVSAGFERLASTYVLLSWVYDAFDELPYLRLRGDPGSGKTRFLLTVGSICYKPIFASGASTVSPLFRMLDGIRGTLILDEGDFVFSDERAEIVKILNNGNARGFPVLRSEVTRAREINPTAYWVYGPKLIATRKPFQDPALESRCLTEETSAGELREDIPIHLPRSFRDEALTLRNRLLMFRFRHLERARAAQRPVDRSIEPRLAQIFGPLLSVVDDTSTREELRDLARERQREMIEERGMLTEAQVLEVIRDLRASGAEQLAIKDMASWFADRYEDDYQRKITTKWIGWVIRSKLHLKTRKTGGRYVIEESSTPRLERLYAKYGLDVSE